MTTVMLSMPPARLAALMSRSAASWGSGVVSRIAWIWGSVTMPVRPSLHRRRRSPSIRGTSFSSTTTSGSVPIDAGQHVAVRMRARLLRRDLACFHHAVHEGVIVRQLAEGAGSQQVGAAVADVAEVRALLVDRGGGERGAHPGDLAVGDRPFEDGAVGGADHLGERRLPAAEQLLYRVQGQARRDGAAAGTAHAVGHGVERRLDQVRVLVALADAADVRGHADDDPHRRSSRTVVPTRILSPGCTMAGAASFWSFTNVPFVEPRSSTYHVPFLPKIRACCEDA